MRRRTDLKIDELHELPLFSACTHKELVSIARLVDEARFPAGQTLMEEGRAGQECFVITEGQATVEIGGELVAELGPGEIVGEMAILDEGGRSATVKSATPIRAVVMSRQAFTGVIEASPRVARRVLGVLARRLREVQTA